MFNIATTLSNITTGYIRWDPVFCHGLKFYPRHFKSISESSHFSIFVHVKPLQCWQATVPAWPCFRHEQVFLAQLPVQQHLITLSRDAGAGACSILHGFSMLSWSTDPQSVGSMSFPSLDCTWRYTLRLWKRAASTVGGRRSGGT